MRQTEENTQEGSLAPEQNQNVQISRLSLLELMEQRFGSTRVSVIELRSIRRSIQTCPMSDDRHEHG
jgi:hypothetical protein